MTTQLDTTNTAEMTSSATTPARPTDTIPTTQSKSATKPKTKKSKARRPRRRGASDSEEEDAVVPSDDESVSSHSASEHSDSDEDEEETKESVETAPTPASTSAKALFADTKSTTPLAWADQSFNASEEVSFDSFNRGEAGVTRGGKRGRGRGGATSAGDRTEKAKPVEGEKGEEKEKKVYTEEQTRKFEERKAKMKERQKAKKKEKQEARRKELEKKDEPVEEDVATQPEASSSTAEVKASESEKPAKKGKGKAKNKKTTAETELVQATSELKVANASAQHSERTPDMETPSESAPAESSDAPIESRKPPVAPRAARDPRSTPRAGGFWTHDQRNTEQYDNFAGRGSWRGRGEPMRGFRGGFRGRGRGGFNPAFARGGYGNVNFAQNIPQEASEGKGKELLEEGAEKTLEMDKLEAELERRKEAQAQRQQEEAQQAEVKEDVPEEAEQVAKTDPVRPVREPKWGHEGFESMQAVQQMQVNRMVIRGRGRGRGFFARGGFVPRTPYHNLPTPQRTPDSPGSKLPPNAPVRPSPLNPVTPSEETATQPNVESLIDSDAVTVKLPGSEEAMPTQEAKLPTPDPEQTPIYRSISRPDPPSQPSTSTSTIRATAPVFVQPKPLAAQLSGVPVFSDGTSSPQPFPANASENGSIGSSGHFATPTYLANGVAVAPNGDYYQVQPPPQDFRPASQSQQQQQSRPFYPSNQRSYQHQQPAFYPQSYSPDLFQQHPSRNNSFGSQAGMNFIPDGRASPFQPYPGTGHNDYFVPPRSSKIAIRAPGASGTPPVEDQGLKRYASIDQSNGIPQQGMTQEQYYAQHYNPYAAGAMGYATNGQMNGWAGQGYAGDGYDYGY